MNRVQLGYKLPVEVAQAIEAQFPGSEQFRYSFHYDPAGRVIELSSYLFGNRVHHETRSYNEDGDKISCASDGQVTLFEYEHDSHGNWTRQITHQPSVVYETLQTITYYD